MDLRDPTNTVVSQRNEDGYVDDTSLGVDGRSDKVLDRLSTSAQRHERLIYATGGKLALQKCMWVLVNWAWTNGVASMETIPTNEDEGSNAKLLLV